MKHNTARALCSAVKRVSGTKKRVAMHTRLDEIGLDSLNFIQLVVTCEDMLGISFDDEDLLLRGYDTVQALYDKCEALKEKAHA